MTSELPGFARVPGPCLPDPKGRQTRATGWVHSFPPHVPWSAQIGRRRRLTSGRRSRRALTLIELLVVIGTLSFLLAMLVPSLSRARGMARRTVCLTNLRSIGAAIHIYANVNRGHIPFGPKAPPMMTTTDLYPSTGAPTTLISLRKGRPVGLGLMLADELSGQPEVLFCPGSDEPVHANAELAKVGREQAQSSYYYRHASVTRLYDPPGVEVLSPDHIRLDNLGTNRNGRPIRALAIDSQFLVSPGFAEFGITKRTHHHQKWANVLYSDGHVVSLSNADGRFTVNLDSRQAMQDAFGLILAVLEQADEEQRSTLTERRDDAG